MPSLARFFAGPASLGRRAAPEDLGGGVGGELAGVAREIGEASARIYDARYQAKLARVGAELAAGLDQDAFGLESDADVDTHEERFQQSAQARLQAAQQQLPAAYRGELETRALQLTERARMRVRANVRQRHIDDALADEGEANRLESRRAAESADPGERDQIRELRFAEIQKREASGLITPRHGEALRNGFDRDLSDADFLQAVEVDPVALSLELRNPDSPLLRGLDAGEVEQRRKQARDAIEGKLQDERQAALFDQGQRDRARREASEAAQRDLIDALVQRDLPRAREVLGRARNVLSPDDYRFAQRRIAAGGGLDEGGRGSTAYFDFSARARRGEAIGAEIQSAALAGDLSREEFDALVRQSTDRRFGEAETFLRGATRQGEFDFDAELQRKQAAILIDFSNWAASEAGQKANADQAQIFARGLLKNYGIRELQQTRRPDDPADPSGTVDIHAARARAQQKYQLDGDRDAYAREALRLEQLEQAQRLQGITP